MSAFIVPTSTAPATVTQSLAEVPAEAVGAERVSPALTSAAAPFAPVPESALPYLRFWMVRGSPMALFAGSPLP